MPRRKGHEKSEDVRVDIGADKDLDVGAFFSGLIDDVRIYSIAPAAEEIEALAKQATLERNETPNIARELAA